MNNFYNYGNIELSWDIDSLNTLSGYGSLTGGSNKNHNDRYFDLVSPNGEDTARTLFDDEFNYQLPRLELGHRFHSQVPSKQGAGAYH